MTTNMTRDEAIEILKKTCLLTAQDYEPTAKVYIESQVLSMLKAQETLTKYDCSRIVRECANQSYSNEIDALLYAANQLEKDFVTQHVKQCCKGKCKVPAHYALGVPVKAWFYKEPTSEERKKDPYWTGLSMQLENGLIFRSNSTDPVHPFSLLNNPKLYNTKCYGYNAC